MKKKFSEVKRKLLHFLTIGYIIGYNITPRDLAIVISGIIVVVIVIFEIIRLRYKRLRKVYHSLGEELYRGEELKRVSGLPWTVFGIFLTILIFDNPKIVNVVLLYVIVGDGMAAIIGTTFGRLHLNGKTLEGSFGCLVVCFICGMIFLKWELALLGSIFATLIEFLNLPPNDNFWIPILSGLLLTFSFNSAIAF